MTKTSLYRFTWLVAGTVSALTLGAACAQGEGNGDIPLASDGGASGTSGASGSGASSGTAGTANAGAGGAGGANAGSAGNAGTSGAAGSGGTGASAGASGASGTSGTSGAAGALPCTVPTDCTGADNTCSFRACNAGVCGIGLAPAGTPLPSQTAGDCTVSQCNGNGTVETVNDDTDVPDDANPCTTDVCTAGVASHAFETVGTSCGENLKCDGAGACVGCVTPQDCPGQDTECSTRTCTSGVCGATLTPSGVALSTQTAGDCLKAQCDGSGNISQIPDNADTSDDGNECTDDACNSGVGSHAPKSSGTACTSGGTVCDGAGTCVQCVVATTCPAAANECQTPSCTSGSCGFDNVASGTPGTVQNTGDCKKNQCDGNGALVSVNDNTDINNDGNPCTVDTCNSGTATHTPASSGTSCGNGQVCNATGLCVGCNTAADCPGQDTECKTRTCTSNTCGTSFAPSGKVVTMGQTSGDCQKLQCNGLGLTVSVADNSDVPVDDGNQCTSETCAAGVPNHPPKSSGAACSQGGTLCNGSGTCVQCLVATTCPGVDTECQTRACNAGLCSYNFAPAGTPLSTQTPGDCQQIQCNGSGAIVSTALNSDIPADEGNPCTTQTCVSGAPQYPAAPNGTSCTDGNACTQTDTCQSGTCSGSNPLVCTPLDSCHTAGTCSSGSGCSNPTAPDGTACTSSGLNGTCLSGSCSTTAICAGGVTCPGYLPTCAAGQTMRTYSNASSFAINDNSTINSTVTVPAGLTIKKVAIYFNITHTFDADLDISLVTPGGTVIDSSSDNGSSGANYTKTVLDSTCASAVASGTAPFSGCYSPETSFASLVNTSATGTWTLRVADDASFDTGTLQNWTLALCTTP